MSANLTLVTPPEVEHVGRGILARLEEAEAIIDMLTEEAHTRAFDTLLDGLYQFDALGLSYGEMQAACEQALEMLVSEAAEESEDESAS